MDFALLKPEIQDYIDANVSADVSKLALQKNPFPEVAFSGILNQISAKSKAKAKLPIWFGSSNILYPSKISVEQTSSEPTALYKSRLVSGESLVDLTGGFGVDDYYFSKTVTQVVHCEINAELSQIVQHNFTQLRASNIECFSGDSFDFLQQSAKRFDWIYSDPSRRNDAKGKVFMLRDCLPNMPELLDFYFSKSDNILIKTAPILDIAAGLSELKHVKRIHIVAVGNEVREVLWELKHGFSGNPQIKTVNENKQNTENFEFEFGSGCNPTFGFPKKYLYEPNSAIMKSGGFAAIGLAFGLEKLQQHSHLYTSDLFVETFPGRIFEVNQHFPYHKNGMKQFLEQGKSNITTRNFPDPVETIRKKWKIKDGGDTYSFFTTDAANDKIVLICTKLK